MRNDIIQLFENCGLEISNDFVFEMLDSDVVSSKADRRNIVNYTTRKFQEEAEKNGLKTSDVNHSENRNLGFSNYLFIDGFEIRISDHGRNPRYNASDFNILVDNNSTNEQIETSIQRVISKIIEIRKQSEKEEREKKEKFSEIFNDELVLDFLSNTRRKKNFKLAKYMSNKSFSDMTSSLYQKHKIEDFGIDEEYFENLLKSDEMSDFIRKKGGMKYFYDLKQDNEKSDK